MKFKSHVFLFIFILTALVSACASAVKTNPSEVSVKPTSISILKTMKPTQTPMLVQPSSTFTTFPETATLTPMPTVSTIFIQQYLKLAYTTFPVVKYDKSRVQLWLIEPQDARPHLLLDIDDKGWWYFAWSRDGQHIAYANSTSIGDITVSIIDILSEEQRQLGYSVKASDPFGPGTEAGIRVLEDGWSLEDKWLHVQLVYGSSGTMADTRFRDVIINIADEKVIELDEKVRFLAWSASDPDKYVYMLSPNYPSAGNESINVSKVGQQKPIDSISGFDNEDYFVANGKLTWSPDEQTAILSAYDNKKLTDVVLLLDFNKQQFEMLMTVDRHTQPLLWSPDGQWVVLWNGDIFLINTIKIKEKYVIIQPKYGDSLYPDTWASDGTMLIYQDGQKIYAVNPINYQNPMEILDLSSLESWNDQLGPVDLWVP